MRIGFERILRELGYFKEGYDRSNIQNQITYKKALYFWYKTTTEKGNHYQYIKSSKSLKWCLKS